MEARYSRLIEALEGSRAPLEVREEHPHHTYLHNTLSKHPVVKHIYATTVAKHGKIPTLRKVVHHMIKGNISADQAILRVESTEATDATPTKAGEPNDKQTLLEPAAFVKKYAGGEAKWDRAKASVDRQDPGLKGRDSSEFYRRVMGRFKSMVGAK